MGAPRYELAANERTLGRCLSPATSDRRIAAHNVGNVIKRYRQPRLASFTDRTNLPDRTKAPLAGVPLCRFCGKSTPDPDSRAAPKTIGTADERR